MPDIIKLLPDSVANQIAAGEVIQRPASVIKELVENAVDAGATEIQVIIKDAGRTLLQVIDNGKGMSETDARMAFERHATSKITTADDLFALHTKGFRGEALASIAAIAHVELQSRMQDNELGTRLVIKGSVVETQEPCACPAGSNFMVKNIFYNVPARRRFLKTDNTEERHILNELYRIALSHTEISFRMMFNNSEKHFLPQANLSQRVAHIFGRGINANLVKVETKTDLVSISGFVGKPEQARKKSGEQYFFANRRFMRHPYLHRAVTEAYQNMLPAGTIPSYFLFLETEPENIDINIHPTKTEIKFTDERTLWLMVRASVREALGKSNVTPSINFDLDENLIPPVSKNKEEFRPPSVTIDSTYNPFDEEKTRPTRAKPEDPLDKVNVKHWEKLTESPERGSTDSPHQESMTLSSRMGQEESEGGPMDEEGQFMQVQKRYILTSVKSGLMLIDQRRAHIRIRYEQHIVQLEMQKGISQSTLYPQEMELEKADLELVINHRKYLERLGLDFEQTGPQKIALKGMPAELKNIKASELVEQFIENYHETELANESSLQEKLALALAKAGAIRYGQKLDALEMSTMTDQLFACQVPNYTPDGKTILTIIESDELKSLLP